MVGEIGYEVRPEWLAGRYWWRIFVAGNPKVLVRYRRYALAAAEALAADEAHYRRDPHGEPDDVVQGAEP